MQFLSIGLFAGLIGLTTGCSAPGGPTQVVKKAYFDIEKKVRELIPLLAELNPEVDKTIVMSGQVENKILQLDSAGWVKELEIFAQANINRPVLRDLYETEMTTEGAWQVVIYKNKNPEANGIVYLKIYSSNELVGKIEALHREENVLYYSERILEMEFGQPNVNMLNSYAIKGKQKLPLQDTVAFEIHGRLSYLN